MFARLVLLLLVIPGAAVAAMARDPISPPDFRLPDVAAPTRYEVHLSIDPRTPTFSGEIAIELRFKRATGILWLNATAIDVERAVVRQGDREVRVSVVPGGEDFVGLQGNFEAGAATARIAYRGKLDPLIVDGLFRQEDGGDWYAISQFQAIGARRAFPCFDEPGWKTPWRLTIDAPEANVVVSNTPQLGATAIEGRAGWRRRAFAETPPLPSYLVALAVGPFDVVEGGVAGKKRTPLRYLAPKGRGGETRYAAKVTPKLLEMLEDYFGIPYPFEKLDSVTIPHLVTFGAMENVGMITYGSQFLLAREHEETPRFREAYAGIAAHEIAHMWFGNLVTLAWWDDTWLNEAFASWIGSKITYAFEPAWDNGVYRNQSRTAALWADRLASARRIHNPVESRNEIDDAFDDITYNKGEEVLSMFEAWLGPGRFQEGVRAFLREHAWGSATSDDFFRALGRTAGDAERVLQALKGFVDRPGAPLLDVILDCTGPPSLVVEQRRLRPAGSSALDEEWTTPACFRYRAGGKDATQCAVVDLVSRRIPLKEATSCPAWVVGNAGGAGHYVTRYWPPQLQRIVERFGSVPSMEAQVLTHDTWLLADAGLLPMGEALVVAEAGLGHGAPIVALASVNLLQRLRDDWLSAPERREKSRIVAARVMPRARELGWIPREADSDDVRALRATLLRFAADRPEGAELRAEARSLALAWIADRKTVDATMAPPILEAAGRFADAATYERLVAAAIAGEIWRERSMLLAGVGRVRDAQLRSRALALTLDAPGGRERLDGRAARRLLEMMLHDDENRDAAIAYVLAHVQALEAKLPKDSMAALLTPMGSACTAAQRDAIARTFESRAKTYMTGPLRYAQALESIDLCLDARR